MKTIFNIALILALSAVFTRALASTDETPSKAVLDLGLTEGRYDVTSTSKNNEICLPGKFKFYGEGPSQGLYLGARMLFGNLNEEVSSPGPTGCQTKTTSKTSRDESKQTGILKIVAETQCPSSKGSYTDSTEIQFQASTIDYKFKRESQNAQFPSFKLNCSFKKRN